MPAKFDRPKIIPKLCELLAAGESLRTICKDPLFPNRMTIYEWSEDDPELATAIARARKAGFDERAEAALERAQSAKDASLARLDFDAERWYLSKLDPKRYGERIQTAQTDTDGNDVKPIEDAPQRLAAILAGIAKRDAGDLA